MLPTGDGQLPDLLLRSHSGLPGASHRGRPPPGFAASVTLRPKGASHRGRPAPGFAASITLRPKGVSHRGRPAPGFFALLSSTSHHQFALSSPLLSHPPCTHKRKPHTRRKKTKRKSAFSQRQDPMTLSPTAPFEPRWVGGLPALAVE